MPRPQTRQKGSAGLLPCPRILPTCFRARISEREVEEHANIAGFRSVSLSLLRPLAKSAQLYCPWFRSGHSSSDKPHHNHTTPSNLHISRRRLVKGCSTQFEKNFAMTLENFCNVYSSPTSHPRKKRGLDPSLTIHNWDSYCSVGTKHDFLELRSSFLLLT